MDFNYFSSLQVDLRAPRLNDKQRCSIDDEEAGSSQCSSVLITWLLMGTDSFTDDVKSHLTCSLLHVCLLDVISGQEPSTQQLQRQQR